MHLPAEAHHLFATQHGVASLDQLAAVGVNPHHVQHLVRVNALINLTKGAYRSPSVPVTELSMCVGVCLTRPHAAIAGPTAGRIWGFRRVKHDRRLHLVAPLGSNPTRTRPGVVTHRTDAIHPDDIVQRADGIRVTTRQRTALDLARSLRGDDLMSVVEQAMHDGALDEHAMRAVAVDWCRHRPWVRRYLEQLDRRLDGGTAESHPEVRLGQALRSHGVAGLVRQHQLQFSDRPNVRFDLAVPEMRWAIEIDVHPSHADSAGRRRDRERDLAVASRGWSVTRISRDRYEQAFHRTVADLVHHHRTLLRGSPRAA